MKLSGKFQNAYFFGEFICASCNNGHSLFFIVELFAVNESEIGIITNLCIVAYSGDIEHFFSKLYKCIEIFAFISNRCTVYQGYSIFGANAMSDTHIRERNFEFTFSCLISICSVVYGYGIEILQCLFSIFIVTFLLRLQFHYFFVSFIGCRNRVGV